MAEAETIEHFFGVYLLYCLNPKYKGRTYIGYTVDPNRRIKQHNKGKQFGGARRTNEKGPWSMVLIIHGFPNDISALRFEWAWQRPHISRRLKHVPRKKHGEKVYEFCLRVLSEMLRAPPWCRLPLTVRWLNENFIKEFPLDRRPPMHMPICYGPVISKKLNKSNQDDNQDETVSNLCHICKKSIQGKPLSCLNNSCNSNSHVSCMSKYFLKDGEYIPVEGQCPKCDKTFLWGDIVRKYKGCYSNFDFKIDIDAANDLYCSDSD